MIKRVVGKMWRALIALIKIVARRVQYKSRIEDKIDSVLARQNDLEKRTLRLELISAMDRGDTAVVHQLYDEYTAMGGNSYCVAMYKDYCKKPTKRKKK